MTEVRRRPGADARYGTPAGSISQPTDVVAPRCRRRPTGRATARALTLLAIARPAALTLTDGLPERRLEPGQLLFAHHDAEHTTVAVLVAGSLQVEIGGNRLPDVTVPGSFIGEIAALLGIERTADVVAGEATTVRIIGDPHAFFESHPSLALELARQLAARLHRLTAYLGDVRTQFAGSEGHLGMVDTVLGRLASRPAVEIDPGSDRSPDY